MKFSNFRLFAALTAFVFLTTAKLYSQLPVQDQRILKYLDSQSVVVGWIDISKIDLQEFAAFRQRLGQPVEANEGEVKASRDALLQLKVNRIYWISDLAGLMKGPESLVIPTPDPQALAVLLKTLSSPQTPAPVFEEDGDCLIGTTRQAVSALREKNGEAIPRLLEALASVEGSHGIVMAAPEHVAAGAAGIMLAFAVSQGETYVKAATEIAGLLPSIQWLTLSGEIPPTTLHLHIETKTPESAVQLAATLNTFSSSKPGIDATSLKVAAVGNSVQMTAASVEDTLRKLETLSGLLQGDRNPDSATSMKQLALAMHNFHDVYGAFPAQSLVDQAGKRLLSWRVLILPFLEQSALYQEFHLDEPWDSEHNLKLVAKMPSVFRGSGPQSKVGTTRLVAPLTPHSTMGRVGAAVKVSDITDGTSNTIWLVQADESHAVIWTKPDDLVIDEKDPVGSMIDPGTKGFWASMADGSARFISRDTDALMLKHLFSIDDGEVIDAAAVK